MAVDPTQAIILIGALIIKVDALVPPLNNGQANALTVKLNAAINQLSKDPPNIPPACGQLKAFINAVNAFINGGILSPSEGGPLINDATAIRRLLECYKYEK